MPKKPEPTNDTDRELVATRQIYEALLNVKEERRATIIKAAAVLLGVPGYWPGGRTKDAAMSPEEARGLASYLNDRHPHRNSDVDVMPRDI
jgi:hypothetical protein